MVLCIDIDDTICHMQQAAIDLFNERYGTKYTLNDFNDYDVMNCMPVDHAVKMIEIYGERGFYNHVKPIKGAKEALQKLINDGHQVYLVTNAIPGTYGEKVEFIKRYFPFIDKSHIIAMKHKYLLRADIMIEDCLQNLMAKHYYHRICFDQPWNRQVKDWVYNIHRCNNWSNVLEVVNKISELE